MKIETTIFWNADTGGAGGSPAAPGATSAPSAAPASSPSAGGSALPDASRSGLLDIANGTSPAAPSGQSVYYPDGLPDQFRGPTERDTLDRLAREVIGRPAPPKAAADYKIDLPEPVAKSLGDLSKDPVIPIYRDVAHKHGLTEKQFNGVLGDLFSQMQDKGIMQPNIDTKAELAKLAPEERDPTRQAAVAAQKIKSVMTSLDDLVTRGVVSKDEAGVARAIGAVAEGVTFLEKLMARGGERGVQVGGGANTPSRSDLQQRMGDPRYDSQSAKFDPRFRAEVDAQWRAVNGVRQ